MKMLFNRFRSGVARFAISRAVVVAMLLGPIIGAMLALGAVAQGATNMITIDNFTFSPKELTVTVGTTVKWVNHDDIPHSVVGKNKAFRSQPALDTDESYSFTFTSAGTFDYSCGLHPQMVGKVVVNP